MQKSIRIIGVGPGRTSLICPEAMAVIEKCDLLIGGQRNLQPFNHLNKKTMVIDGQLDKVCEHIDSTNEKIAVLASGDPNIFSITEVLKRKLPHITFDILPGVSALQYFCAKIPRKWNDLKLVSCHGKAVENVLSALMEERNIMVWTGGGVTPTAVCQALVANGIGAKVTIGENLSYENERIVSGTPEEMATLAFSGFALLLIEVIPNEHAWQAVTTGIPDHLFIRGKAPMTKQEVRAISLSKLMLKFDSLVWDIGAGTGSVAIECGLQAKRGQVYAIERNMEAVELITQNKRKFGAYNVNIITGIAPECLKDLPQPDCVFIGGSGGNMHALLAMLDHHVRVVVNTVTIQSTYEAVTAMESLGFDNIDIVQAAISIGKAVGGKHLMQAQNPIYIISGD
ncbi:MAG: precorrin-6y C5,15-methyltransferase (decarboxylating) subunit CbiE, partial [Hyphomonadaceae bacterium]|nr:precorrin-6y C5,15-methyltransferase (decarboxylating) subunit CbiE [Clostridia bacterium]